MNHFAPEDPPEVDPDTLYAQTPGVTRMGPDSALQPKTVVLRLDRPSAIHLMNHLSDLLEAPEKPDEPYIEFELSNLVGWFE